MNKKRFFKLLGLCAGLSLAVGAGVALSSGGAMEVGAADTVLTFSLTSNPGGWPTANSTTETAYNYTLKSVAYEFTLKNCKCNSGYLMCTQPAAIGLPKLSDKKLSKIVASNSSGCSTSVRVGVSSSVSSASYISGGDLQTWSKTSSTYTYNLSDTENNTRYYLYVTNKNAQITQLELTYSSQDVALSGISLDGSYKTSFTVGDTFSFGGTVTANYEGGSTKDVTSSATFSGYNMSDAGNYTVTVSYTEGETTKTATYSITVNAPSKNLESITVTTPPTKTTYDEGESFDPTGMAVTATFDNNSSEDVTGSCSFTPNGALSMSNTSITITYSYGGTSKSTTQDIVVNEKHGTSTNPYSVAEAIADIQAGDGTGSTGAYSTGIVSKITTAYSSQYKNVSFDISDDGTTNGDQLRAYRCVGSTGFPITSEDSVKVGDRVVVKGDLIYYNNSIYEFSAGCTLEGLTPNTISSLTVTDNSSNSWRVGNTVKAEDLSVVVNYSNIAPITITDGTGVAITSGALLENAGDNVVLISYTDSYGTKTGSVTINAAAALVLGSVSITGTASADKNGIWDLSGLTVVGTSNGGEDGDMGDITNDCVLTSSDSTETPGPTSITVHVNYKNGTTELDVKDVAATISNIEYYTDTLTYSLIGITGTSYSAWTNKKSNSNAIYAGTTAGGNSSIQLNTGSPKGIVSTSSGGTLNSITISINSNTGSNKSLQVYGSHSAFSGSADLTSGGTLVATLNAGKLTYTFEDNYEYIGLYCSSGALYLDEIQIVWKVEVVIKTLDHLEVTSSPTKSSYAAGQSLNLTGLTVYEHYKEDGVDPVQTVSYTTSPADGYVFTSDDASEGLKEITITSTVNDQISTSFTVTVTPKIPTALNRTSAASWTDTQTLAQGAGRWKAVFSDASEQTNIKIGDENTVLKIGGVAVDTSALASLYAGQDATLEFTQQNITVSNQFTINVNAELSVDSFEGVPEYVLVTETSDVITANFTSLNGEPDSYSVSSSNSAKLSVSFDPEMVSYDATTYTGVLMFTVSAGSTQGQYNVTVSVTKGERTESKTLAILVRGEVPVDNSGSYRKIDSFGSIPNGNYVIAANVNGTYYAMTSSLSSGKFASTEITVGADGVITSDVENTMVFTFATTNSGTTIQNGSTYINYVSSTNLGSSDSAYYFSASAGTKGTFRLASVNASARGIVFRASSVLAFGGYAVSNITANGAEYYDLELFEYATTQTNGFDLVNSFVETNMHMSDVSLTNRSDTNACRGDNGYYLTAKRAWNAMVTDYSGQEDLEEIFRTSYSEAYERYMAWADACGDTNPFVGTTIQNAGINNLFGVSSSESNASAILIIISMMSAMAIGGTLFLRSRKEQ